MNKILRALFSLVFTATILFSQAQPENSNVYTERLEVHVNTNFLITGETLYYSIHCLGPAGKYSTLSKLAYVELIGENERPFLQIKVPLTDGRGAGDFFLPSTLPTGNYTLIAYTRWMRNFRIEDFFQQQVTIINPYLKATTSEIQTATVQPIAATSVARGRLRSETTHIQITSDKQKYSTRQKVIITIKNNNPLQDCKIALNVHEYHAGVLKSESPGSYTQEQVPDKKKDVAFLPDFRGESISGVLTEKGSGRAIGNSLVYLTVPGPSHMFQVSQTDSLGRFCFSTKNIHSQDGLQFQIDHQIDPTSVDVKLDDEFVSEYKKFQPKPLVIDTALRKQIEKRNVYGQIENAYFIKKRDSIITRAQVPFFAKPDKVYKLDDFTRFPTMEDIFKEYMYEVVVLKRDGKFLIRLINSNTKNGARFLNTPLIIMDGIPIFDTEVLMSYNPLLIKTVSLVTRPYVFGGILFDGILAANTYTGHAQELAIKPIKKNYTPWQYPKEYYSPDYSAGEHLARIPDYRIQLFWNPMLTISAGQEMTVEFYTSDVEGKFLIEGTGFNTNGESVAKYQSIEVRK
jgi:hypothetical protein